MQLTKHDKAQLTGEAVPREEVRRSSARRATYIKNPEYLRDLLRLPAREIQRKWGVGRSAVNNHQHLSAAEIRRRLSEVDHG
jgi:hypothetical protein